jgi:acyl-CoA thioesterase FadM
MVTAEQTLVLVDVAERRPRRVPDDFRAPIRAFEGGDLEG